MATNSGSYFFNILITVLDLNKKIPLFHKKWSLLIYSLAFSKGGFSIKFLTVKDLTNWGDIYSVVSIYP